MPDSTLTTSEVPNEQQQATPIDVRPVGDAEHESGTYGIEFYGADGSFLGHAEISDGFLQSSSDVVLQHVYSSENGLAASAADATSQMTMLCTASVVIVAMLFAIFGAICVRTLVKSFERR